MAKPRKMLGSADAKPEVYDQIAAQECAKMEAALRAISDPNEPNPIKINWRC